MALRFLRSNPALARGSYPCHATNASMGTWTTRVYVVVKKNKFAQANSSTTAWFDTLETQQHPSYIIHLKTLPSAYTKTGQRAHSIPGDIQWYACASSMAGTVALNGHGMGCMVCLTEEWLEWWPCTNMDCTTTVL